ncbi:hypothetical protein HYT24_03495, partial [Candidatus Pacearchaeota archaeon]|nr:hypothetical protein [Candidatus Pacearchaeota archaeon]
VIIDIREVEKDRKFKGSLVSKVAGLLFTYTFNGATPWQLRQIAHRSRSGSTATFDALIAATQIRIGVLESEEDQFDLRSSGNPNADFVYSFIAYAQQLLESNNMQEDRMEFKMAADQILYRREGRWYGMDQKEYYFS